MDSIVLGSYPCVVLLRLMSSDVMGSSGFSLYVTHAVFGSGAASMS